MKGFTSIALAFGLFASAATAVPIEVLPNGVDSYSTRAAWSAKGTDHPVDSSISSVEEIKADGTENNTEKRGEESTESVDCYSTRAAWAAIEKRC